MSFFTECDILKSEIFPVSYLQNEGEVYLATGSGGGGGVSHTPRR